MKVMFAKFIEPNGPRHDKKTLDQRDFHATGLNIHELHRGIRRASKRIKNNPAKAAMYMEQIEAYRKRIDWYSA